MKRKLISITLVFIMALGICSMPATAATAAAPAMTTTTAATATANPTTSKVSIDGNVLSFEAYNIEGSNFFKLRDLAYTLNGTAKQFEVGYDNATRAVTLVSGEPYTPIGGEMTPGDGSSKTVTPTPSRIYLDGKELILTVYNISGSNFFKLRDLMEAIDVFVGYDNTTKDITLDTSKHYAPESSATQTTAAVFDWPTPVPASKLLDYYEMTSAERALYDQLSSGIANFELEIKVTETDTDMILTVRSIMLAVHTEFFWWEGNTRTGVNDSGEACIWPVYVVDGKELFAARYNDGSLRYPSAADTAAAAAWIESVKTAIASRLNDLPLYSGMTTYEMELVVHDWMCENVEYLTTDPGDSNCRTIYGALIEGEANCNGTGKTFQYILRLLGIECVMIYVTNKALTDESHTNNAAKLDGEWYQLDVTWGASNFKSSGLPVHYYFNRTGEYMRNLGFVAAVDGFSININPSINCTGTKYDYYLMTNSNIASDDDFISKVPSRVAMAKANGEQAFELEISALYSSRFIIEDMLKLIDLSLYEGLAFYYDSAFGLVWGVFK